MAGSAVRSSHAVRHTISCVRYIIRLMSGQYLSTHQLPLPPRLSTRCCKRATLQPARVDKQHTLCCLLPPLRRWITMASQQRRVWVSFVVVAALAVAGCAGAAKASSPEPIQVTTAFAEKQSTGMAVTCVMLCHHLVVVALDLDGVGSGVGSCGISFCNMLAVLPCVCFRPLPCVFACLHTCSLAFCFVWVLSHPAGRLRR